MSGVHLRGISPGYALQVCSGDETLATCVRFDGLGNCIRLFKVWFSNFLTCLNRCWKQTTKPTNCGLSTRTLCLHLCNFRFDRIPQTTPSHQVSSPNLQRI